MIPNKKTFLVEIGTEELPSKKLHSIAVTFSNNFIEELHKNNLQYDQLCWFASPRRLAVKIDGLNTFFTKAVILPSVPDNLASKYEKKSNDLIYKNNFTKNLLPAIVKNALSKLIKNQFPSMRWGEGKMRFIRPVHSVLLLFGDELIPIKLLGIQSSTKIFGHRFMGQLEFNINSAEEYAEILLTRGKVIACYEKRKIKILSQVKNAAFEIGGKVKIDNFLLEELTSLVEWPVVLIGSFDNQFLSLPILKHIIQDHQKCFLVYNYQNNQLIPKFILITNIESQYPKKIIEGNEKIIHSRLCDAKFFINEDRKKHLYEYFSLLEKISFQHQLGSLRDKAERIKKLAIYIAQKINVNLIDVKRAALLAKCDLATNIVFEFPKTQGIIGMHYALLDSEKEEIAIAIKEHYHPCYKNDCLPSNLIGCTIAIADKIDTLIGIIGIGMHSTGDQDPFALRRNALGLLRIILEKKLGLDLYFLIQKSIKSYNNKLTNITVANDVMQYLFKRLASWYKEKGYRNDLIQAVSSRNPTLLCDFDARIKALSSFKESFKIIMINKRVSNFLTKNLKENLDLNQEIDLSLFIQDEEKKLAYYLINLTNKLQTYFDNYNYPMILTELIPLYDLVNNFFQFVPINISNNSLRINRFKLLVKLQEIFFKIADFSLLQY
ncbi:MAG: glycine--tRNA ligase subunit beta [Candidatus Dasytiphilus stammeri]